MSRGRRWWMAFTLGTAAVVAAMIGVSVIVLQLEEAELRASSEAEYQEDLRLSLWRMDAWMAPRLARETARPYFEYLPYYAHERAYTRLLNEIEPGEVRTASALLTFRSDYIPLHIQLNGDGRLTSPQVPEGNLRDLAEATLVDAVEIEAKQERLARAAPLLGTFTPPQRAAQIEGCLMALNADIDEVAPPPTPLQQGLVKNSAPDQQARSKVEWVQRAQQYAPQQIIEAQDLGNSKLAQVDEAGATPADAVAVSAFAPIWLEGPDGDRELAYLRNVHVGDDLCVQGFLVDWDALRTALLDQVDDLFPGARLTPVADTTTQADATAPLAAREPTTLATIPAALEVARTPTVVSATLTPARLTLLITWGMVLMAIVAAAFSLQASIAYGERRTRFASAVTHELRTPLTTFRLYSEMLADGMVTEESQRRSYLETLKRESSRLSTLVENVLAYARLEKGRKGGRVQRMSVGSLLEQVTPPLQQRTEHDDIELKVSSTAPDDAAVNVDVEAVGQIMFNLVDNACKYGCREDRSLELAARVDNGRAILEVRDHGPGVPPELARRIFSPFVRGEQPGSESLPGIGLGLSLCVGLASELGGELTLATNGTTGACFQLALPASRGRDASVESNT